MNTGPSWTFQAHRLRARKTPGAWWFRNRGPQGRTATHRSQWLFAAGDEHVAPAEDETRRFFLFFRGAMGCHKICRGHNFSDVLVVAWGFWKTWCEMGRVTPNRPESVIIHEFHGLPSTGFVWYIKFISTSIGNGPAWQLRAISQGWFCWSRY